jgi:hypothetical protein
MQINKKGFLLIALIFMVTKSFSQSKIEGVYCTEHQLNDFSNCFTFTDNSEFRYEESGDLGIQRKGSGTYKIVKKQLILNYNKTKVKYSSYHRISFWKSDKDSISLKFKISDIRGKRIKGAIIIIDLKTKIGLKVDSNGIANIKLKKSTLKNKITVNHLGFWTHTFDLILDKNYDIEINLNNGDNPALIKDKIIMYQIIENYNGNLVLKNGEEKNKLYLRKQS